MRYIQWVILAGFLTPLVILDFIWIRECLAPPFSASSRLMAIGLGSVTLLTTVFVAALGIAFITKGYGD